MRHQIIPTDICKTCGRLKAVHRCGPARGRTTPKTCEQCGQTFDAENGELKRGAAKYCSKRCYGDAKNGEGLARFWERLEKLPSGCWEWTGPRLPQGYGQLTVNKIHTRAHKVAWELTNAPVPPGLWVLHKCDNPPCCNPQHLYLGTVRENTDDKLARDRQPRGEQIMQARFTMASVKDIRTRRSAGEYCSAIARDYGVDEETIRLITLRRTWAHVP